MSFYYKRRLIDLEAAYGISAAGDLYSGHLPDGIRGTNYPPGFFKFPANRDEVGITERDDTKPVVQIHKSITASRNNVISKVKGFRDALMFQGGVYVDGFWFHSDLQSRNKYLFISTSGIAPTGASPDWKTMNGAKVLMSVDLAAKIISALIEQDSNIYSISEAHISIIDTLSGNELTMYNWKNKWPKLSPKFKYIHT